MYTKWFSARRQFEEEQDLGLSAHRDSVAGYRAGSTIEWDVPSGRRRLYILEVEYQPEAAGLAA
jgi:hypothetical protein